MKAAMLLASFVAPLMLGGCLIVHEERKPARVVEVEVERVVSQTSAAPAQDARADGLVIKRDVIYGHHDGMANVYDVIKPANANGSAVLYMVSGGWVSRWSDPETRLQQFKPLLDAGITVIPVHHGSAPRFKVPEAHADVKRALRHVSLNATNYGLDATRLGVFGGSAGGHLSLMLGLGGDDGDPAAEDPVLRGPARIKAIVAYYPPVDLRPLAGPSERFPALDFPKDQAAAISPILFVDAKDPPTLIVHGDKDDLVPLASGQSIHDALKKAGVKTELVIIAGGDHGFSELAHRAEAYAAMAKWFRENL